MTHPAEAHFLHSRDNQLQKSAEVSSVVGYMQQYGEKVPNSADARIGAYLGFLATDVNDGFLTGDQASIQRQVEASIIDATPQTAEAYFMFNAKVAAEQGIRVEARDVSADVKLADVQRIQSDQRKQLTEWAQYLNSPDAPYPDWFKHYVMTTVPKLTKFNDQKDKFEARSNSSFALFPELDRESLALTYDVLSKKIHKQPLGRYNAQLLDALHTGSFAGIYAEANKYGFAITPELRAQKHGEWKKYDQTSSANHADRLATDIAAFRTGWCTAGKETAHTQLTNGDFYVWYSRNAGGKAKVPRIAIRMEQGRVREVRGIGVGQELEPELIDTAMERLQTLDGGQEYLKTAADMKLVTDLQKRLAKNPDDQLSRAEVRFLYELGTHIDGFGYQTDPRIAELKALRGERDHAMLKELAVEHIREHFETSFAAYDTVVNMLGCVLAPNALSRESASALYANKLAQWEQNGVLAYAAERLITHGELHAPVMTPNVLLKSDEIKRLAIDFGKAQPYPTHVDHDLYDAYSAQDLSGYLPKGDAAMFSLIPNKYTTELGVKPQAEQQQSLKYLQSTNPQVGYHIPSVLTSVMHWYTLRAGGDNLSSGSVWERTAVRHIDLTAQRVLGSRVLPYSSVHNAGEPRLRNSVAGGVNRARVAVGKKS